MNDAGHLKAATVSVAKPGQVDASSTVRRLAVVLPAYNEEGAIEQTVADAMAKLPQLVSDHVVIVVNDGSTDKTAAIVTSLVSMYGSRLVVVSHGTNKGYGAAVRAGFDRALVEGADTILIMDSDGQFDVADLRQCLPLLDTYDAVFGYRVERQDHLMRRLNAWAWKHLVGVILGVQIKDLDCAFKVVRADFIRSVHLTSSGAVISAELLTRFRQAGLHFAEVGVHHLPRVTGTATGANLVVIARAFRELIALRITTTWESIQLRLQTKKQYATTDTSTPMERTRTKALISGLQWIMEPHRVALLLIFFLAVLLRLHDLRKQSLWLDEIGEGVVAQHDWPQLFEGVRSHAGATPLDYIGVKLVISVLGHGTEATRLWAFALGCLAVFVMYAVATLLFDNKFAGLAAAFLLTLSPFLVYYSQEARFYSLLAIMVLINLYVFQKAVNSRRQKWWAVFALTVAAGLYSHYYTALLLPVEGLYVTGTWVIRSLVARFDRAVVIQGVKQTIAAGTAIAVGFAAFMPWIFYATRVQLDAFAYPPLPALTSDWEQQILIDLFGMGHLAPTTAQDSAVQVGVTACILVLATLGFILAVAMKRFEALIPAGLIVAAIPLVWAIDTHGHYWFSDRQVIFVVPLVLLLAGGGIGCITESLATLVAAFPRRHNASVLLDKHFEAESSHVQDHRTLRYSQASKNVALAVLSLGFMVLWIFLNADGLTAVYAGTWNGKADWRGAANFVAADSCTDSVYYSYLPEDYDYGIGYYDAKLLQHSAWIYTAPGHYEPSVAAAVMDTHFGQHDWLILGGDALSAINKGMTADQYLISHGWHRNEFNGLLVYHRADSCTVGYDTSFAWIVVERLLQAPDTVLSPVSSVL